MSAGASAAIATLTAANPALFGLARDGSSAATGAFVAEPDSSPARDRVAQPLRRVLTDIATTRANLGGDLDPLDLTPLHQQLYGGDTAIGGTLWTQGFRRRVATDAARGHLIDRALVRLALQSVQQIAFTLAPFTSGVSLLLLLGTATAAAGVQAYGSYRVAQATTAAEGTAVRPGTDLVRPGSAEFARMNAEADTVAVALALLALGAAGFQAWRAGADARALQLADSGLRSNASSDNRRPSRYSGGREALDVPAIPKVVFC